MYKIAQTKVCHFHETFSHEKAPKHRGYEAFSILCPERESNSHVLTDTRSLVWPVYQFQQEGNSHFNSEAGFVKIEDQCNCRKDPIDKIGLVLS
jgi:hypothetical protein